MTDPRDYKLDLSPGTKDGDSHHFPDPEKGGHSGHSTFSAPPVRPFLAVLFACCNVYQRVYRSADGSAYAGRCPRCGTPVRFAVGPAGTSARFFIVT